MKIIEKETKKTIAIIDDDTIRIIDAKKYELVEDKDADSNQTND